jgi:hypothetical protein
MRGIAILFTALVALAVAPSCGSSSNPPGNTGKDGGGGSGGSGGGGSGGSGGGGSGGSGGSDGSAPTDGSRAETGPGIDAGSCLGSAFLSAVGKNHLLVGGAMTSATAMAAPFDMQYVYISGGLPDGTGPCASCSTGCTTGGGATSCAGSSGCAWWGCWQYDLDPPGDYVRTFEQGCAEAIPKQVPMITYYQLLQSSGVTEGAPEVNSAAANLTFMTRYLADWRFLMQQIGSTVALLHIEPDFWGYAEQTGGDPTTMPAAVASANPTDCGSLPNTIAGMGKCMIAMTRKYAPHALVALHASAWSTNIDVTGNTNPSFDVAGEAKKTAAFLAACGESSADFVVVETSDRDAGYYQTVEGKNVWWDDTNKTLPDFAQDFTWVKALTEALNKPALWWQTPLGNSAQNNTPNHYQDNRVDYFMGNMSQLAAAHGVGAAFGAGAGDQTTPETDGNNLVMKANAYYSAGAQPLCP